VSTTRVNFASDTPRHRQVEKILRSLIARRAHRDGLALPGEVQLAADLGVSRQTVRQAMSTLVGEGLIERRRNAGTRLAPRPLVTQLTDWASFTAEMGRQGVRMKLVFVSSVMSAAPIEVRRFFKTDARAKVLKVVRVRGDDVGPVVEFESWLHPRLPLRMDDDFSQPLYELSSSRSGVVPSESRELLGATAADARLAKVLKIATGSPVLTRIREVSDEQGRAVEWCRCVYRADRFSYAIQLTRPI
jgi:GntR family transcriptional regulator